MAEPDGYEKSRSELLNEAVKASLIVNGGGAVAMLGFIQAIWTVSTPLGHASILALFLMSIALFLTMLVPVLRTLHSKKAGGMKKTPTIFSKSYYLFLYASPVLFILANGYLAYSAWQIQS